ncbi:MAG: BMP family protein [Verrucomicrobiota bacterium]
MKVFLLLFLALATVGGHALAEGASLPTAPLKVALILGGRVNDPGYYHAGYEALLAVKEKYHAETVYQENLSPVAAEEVLRELGEDGFAYVIVMGGGTYDDAIRQVAADYPAMKFVIVSGAFTQLPNVVSIRTGHPGVAFLAGVLMAEMSSSQKLGLIGGRASPPAIADHVAVIAGARYANPQIKILDAYTESYDDPALAKEAALAQIEQGVDLIYANANTSSFGVFEAARERGVFVVGAATDQNEIAPNTILTSVVYGTDRAVLHLIDLDRSGQGWENKIYTMDLAQLDIAPFHSLDGKVSAADRQRLAEVRQQIIAGQIHVPTSYAEINLPSPGHTAKSP